MLKGRRLRVSSVLFVVATLPCALVACDGDHGADNATPGGAAGAVAMGGAGSGSETGGSSVAEAGAPGSGGTQSAAGGSAGAEQIGPGGDGNAPGPEGGAPVSNAGQPPSEPFGGAAGLREAAGAGLGGQPSATGGGAGEGGSSDGCAQVAEFTSYVQGVDVSTLTGSSASGLHDGALAEALFNNPVNVALVQQQLYVTDCGNNAVRAVDLDTGTVSTLYEVEAPSFYCPFSLAVGGAGELFVGTDGGPATQEYPAATDGSLWRLDTEPGGAPELVLETNGRPRGLVYLEPDAAHDEGRLVFSDLHSHTLQVLDLATSDVSVLAGLSGHPGFLDGTGTAARFNLPYGLAVLDGDVIVADYSNHALRRVTLDGTVTTFVGNGCPGLVDGPVATALFNSPKDVSVDDSGNVYLSDRVNFRIRVIHDGVVRTLAGGPQQSYADGDGESARFYAQEGLDVAPDGSALYVADGNAGNEGRPPYHRIRLLELPTLE